jgi:hypothetical protein
MTLAAANDVHSDGFFTASLAEVDPEIAGWIGKELGRQRDKIELIASENITSLAVLQAAGSVLTNKYAAGASTSTRSRPSRSSAPSACSAQGSPTSSRTAAAR